MSYRIDVTRAARREIRALPGYIRGEVRDLVRALAVDPSPARAKELRGKPDIYRIWVAGSWRLAYEIDEENKLVRILRVRHKDAIDYDSITGYVHEEAAEYGP